MHQYAHLQKRIRTWAREQGLPVRDVGALPRGLMRAYLDAHPEHDQQQDAIHDNQQEPA